MVQTELDDNVMKAVKAILESTRDVFIHDHGAFTSKCGPECGWYIATKKTALDKAFQEEVTDAN